MTKQLIEYYSEDFNEDLRTEASRARSLEFQTTLEILDEHISENASIIDIGAGTGKYALHYGNKGHQVFAVEIVPKHIQIIESKAGSLRNQNLTVKLGDARNLHEIKDNSFEMVLCLGPFYHLRKNEDRIKCLKECKRIVKSKGIIAVAYINKHCAVATFLHYNINISEKVFDSILSEDYSFETKTDKFFDISYFSDPDSTERQIKDAGLKVIDHVGVDGPFALLDKQIDNISTEEFQALMSYHRKTCRNKSILGYSRHGLVICKK